MIASDSIPTVGFNMHPRWVLENTAADFLAPLRTAGLGALEYGLDANDPYWPDIVTLVKECQRLGFVPCFHGPYRPPYAIAGFADQERTAVEAAYGPMLDVAASFAPAVVVIHGAHSATRPYAALYADTVVFLRWVLERYPSLTFALENLGSDPKRVKIGVTRDELLCIVERIGDPRLGICWDMGHDVLAGRYNVPHKAWLQHVCHVHVHDVDLRGVDHYPLFYGGVPYKTWLSALTKAGFEGIATLEIKGGQLISRDMAQITEILVHSIGEIHRFLSPLD